MSGRPTALTVDTGGHSPPVIVFVDESQFLQGVDAEGEPPLVARQADRIAALEERLRKADDILRLGELAYPFGTIISLSGDEVSALRAALRQAPR